MGEMLLFRNLRLLDPAFDEPRGGHEVLVERDRIREVSDRPITSNATVIDCGGRSTNDVHTSLCNAMGLDDATFGNPAYCDGPLAGLRA